MFSNIITTNIQKVLNTANAGTKHTYIISNNNMLIRQRRIRNLILLWFWPL